MKITLSPEGLGPLFRALAEAQAEYPPVVRDSTARVLSRRTQAAYQYEYASFASVLAALRPVLARHGLAVVQGSHRDEQGLHVATLLGHAEGGWIMTEGSAPLAPDATIHEVVSALTYLRRHLYLAVACAAPEREEDDDAAQAVQGHAAAPSAGAPPPASQPPGPRDLFVERVDEQKTANPNIRRWVVTLSDGRVASTIKASLALFAETCAAERIPVRAVIERAGPWQHLVKLEKAHADTPTAAPPPAADDLF